MGKKIRYKLLQGSLRQPLLQFTQKVQFFINPIGDIRGTRIAEHWHKSFKNTKPKYRGVNFDISMNYNFQTSSSYVIMNFVNGWKHGYYFRQASNEGFISTVESVNKLVAFERAMQGEEDEFPDEE